MKAHYVIKRPLLTEKANQLKEVGDEDGRRPQVSFQVNRDANKVEIRRAIEELFKVKVEGVRTLIVRGKEKRVGRFMGRRPAWKKAIVTLAAGEKVEFFEGV